MVHTCNLRRIRTSSHHQAWTELEALLVRIRSSWEHAQLFLTAVVIACANWSDSHALVFANHLVNVHLSGRLTSTQPEEYLHVCISYALRDFPILPDCIQLPHCRIDHRSPRSLLREIREISLSCPVWCVTLPTAAILWHVNRKFESNLILWKYINIDGGCTFNPRTQETEAGISRWVWGHPGLYSES